MSDSPSPPTEKRCRDCGEMKQVAEFWRRKKSPDGLALYCKACFSLRNARAYRDRQAQVGKRARPYRRYSAVPEGMKYCSGCAMVKPVAEFGSNRANKSGRADYCRPCHNAIMAEGKRRLHGSQRSYLLKLRYGITEEQVEERLARQGGICLICLSAKAVHVDHDHRTGVIRGLLCFSCNGALGQFADDPRRMRMAAAYLERHVNRPHWRPVDSQMVETLRRYGRQDARLSARARQRHRISSEDEFRLASQRKDRCPICELAAAVHVDHCHETGAVRGLLCPECNTGMGQLKDDPAVLRRAAGYLDGVAEEMAGGGGSGAGGPGEFEGGRVWARG